MATQALVDKIRDKLLNNALQNKADLAVLECGPGQAEWRWRAEGNWSDNYWLEPVLAEQLLSLLQDQNQNSYKFDYSQNKLIKKLLLQFLKPQTVLGLTGLDLTAENWELLQQALTNKQGLMLICGPTAIDLPTVAYAALQNFNPKRYNIVAIESPILQDLPGINQIQLTPRLRFYWEDIVRQIKQQDADIIYLANPAGLLLDELLELADSKLIIVSLTADTIYDGLRGLAQLSQQPSAILPNLRLALLQKLKPRVCGVCAEPQPLDYKLLDQLHNKFELEDTRALRQLQHWSGAGCVYCSHSGLDGQVGLHEILPISLELTKKLGAAIKPSHKTLIAQELPQTLFDDAFAKTFSGLIPISELLSL